MLCKVPCWVNYSYDFSGKNIQTQHIGLHFLHLISEHVWHEHILKLQSAMVHFFVLSPCPCTNLSVCFSPQLTFTEAMRNKARLSITGSVGENGRVLTPDCPKAVHAGPPLRQSSGLALVSSELPWKPKTSQVPYSNNNNNNKKKRQ